MKKTIGVFFGGVSPEHEISVLTGVQAYHALSEEIYNKVPIFVDTDGQFYTGNALTDTKNYKNKQYLLDQVKRVSFAKERGGVAMIENGMLGSRKTIVDCALLAFHGEYGEGGGFQGFCETLGLPHTSSSLLGASLCMDKSSMKKILERENIPSAKYYEIVESNFSAHSIEQKLNYPMFVKPSNGGSSIGVNRVTHRIELLRAIEVAFAYGSKVLIEEEFAKDSEINISYLGNWNGVVAVSEAEEVYSENEFLDFENKYLKGSKSKKTVGTKGMASASRIIPANISKELLDNLVADGEKAFRALNCSGLVRIDFLVNKKTGAYVLVEVNTIPGSFAYYLWEKKGVSFGELLEKIIQLAFEQYTIKKNYSRRISSQIFKNL